MASRCTAVDSCVLLRMILRENPGQTRMVTNLLLSGGDFYVDGVVVAEVVYVLSKMSIPRNKIIESIWLILGNPMFVWDEKFFEPIFEKYVSHPSLSFDDLVLAARVEAKGHKPLWTFDRKLANQTEVAELVQ